MVASAVFGGQGDPEAKTVEAHEETLKEAYDAGVTLVKSQGEGKGAVQLFLTISNSFP